MRKTGQNENKIINGPGSAGYFEEFLEGSTGDDWPKCLGVRLVENNDENRPLGVAGRRDFVLTENTTLLRCFREVVIKASKKNPIAVTTMLQRLCK